MRDIASPLSGFGSPFGRRRGLLTSTAIARLLFSTDEPGFFYDFDDWSTLFQDTAGTQPVTAPNQGVALALDKRLGLELGPELVTNGTFDSDTDWSLDGGISIVDGLLRFDSAQSGNIAAQPITLTAGKFYEIKLEVSGYSEGTLRPRLTGGTTLVLQDQAASGDYRVIFVPTAGNNQLELRCISVSTFNVNSVSVRELKGNHATQATTAARPLTAVHPDGGVRNGLGRSQNFRSQDIGVPTNDAVVSIIAVGDAPSDVQAALIAQGIAVDTLLFIDNPPGANRSAPILSDTLAGSGDTTYSLWCWLVSGQFQVSTGGFPIIIVDDNPEFERRTAYQEGTADEYRFRTPSSTGGTAYVALAQREMGAVATPYQRVNSFLDVTEAGKRSIRRLYFNGTSHFMETPVITPGTDKAQVFAGVRRIDDNTASRVIFSYRTNEPDGSFLGFSPGSGGSAGFRSRLDGTSGSDVNASSVTPPVTRIWSSLFDRAGAGSNTFRLDGAQVGVGVGSGSGVNFPDAPVFIGTFDTGTLFFNGFLDQLITRFGPNLDTATIEKTEKYVSTKVPEVETL